LLHAIAAGDPRASLFLWKRYAAVVRRVLDRAMSRSTDVEDALQEVFLRFFRQAPNIKDPSAIRAFILSIARRVAHGELRRQRLGAWLALTDAGTLPEDEFCEPTKTMIAAHLADALARTDTRAQHAFSLRYLDGLELVDVAKALGCSLATAKRDLAAVHAELGEVLDEPLARAYLERRRAA
jgi:RNA polymerase sigma-70 factor (ECF subfamily)